MAKQKVPSYDLFKERLNLKEDTKQWEICPNIQTLQSCFSIDAKNRSMATITVLKDVRVYGRYPITGSIVSKWFHKGEIFYSSNGYDDKVMVEIGTSGGHDENADRLVSFALKWVRRGEKFTDKDLRISMLYYANGSGYNETPEFVNNPLDVSSSSAYAYYVK